VVVRLDFESTGPTVSDIDDAGIFSRSLQDALAARGQPLQMDARGFVGTMFAPHHAEDAELGERWFAFSKKLLDLFVFVRSKAVLPEGLRRKGMGYRGSHGEALLSHLAGPLGRPNSVCKTFEWLARATQ
jgi:hypothetical protein